MKKYFRKQPGFCLFFDGLYYNITLVVSFLIHYNFKPNINGGNPCLEEP